MIRRPTRNRRFVSVGRMNAGLIRTLLVVGLLVACSADNENATTTIDKGEIPSTAETSLPTLGIDTTSTTTSTLVGSRNTLSGRWIASADSILSANLANLGGVQGMKCDGEIVMTLGDDGDFLRAGEVSCSIDGYVITGQTISSEGTWTATAETIDVVISRNDSYSESPSGAGTPMRFPIPDQGLTGATYEVSATTLTITFTDASVGTVTQTYSRG